MTPEAKTTKQIMAYLKQVRAAGAAIWWLKLHGGPMQRAGVPDLLVVVDGLAIFLEIKRVGGKATPLQCHTIQKLCKAGAVAEVVESVDQVRRILTTAGVFRCFDGP